MLFFFNFSNCSDNTIESNVVFDTGIFFEFVLMPNVPIDADFFCSILKFDNKNQQLMISH